MLDLLEATITKEACDMCYCKIKVDGNKECDVSFVKHNNTTHLNEHKKKLRPKRMMGPGDVRARQAFNESL